MLSYIIRMYTGATCIVVVFLFLSDIAHFHEQYYCAVVFSQYYSDKPEHGAMRAPYSGLSPSSGKNGLSSMSTRGARVA